MMFSTKEYNFGSFRNVIYRKGKTGGSMTIEHGKQRPKIPKKNEKYWASQRMTLENFQLKWKPVLDDIQFI